MTNKAVGEIVLSAGWLVCAPGPTTVWVTDALKEWEMNRIVAEKMFTSKYRAYEF